MIDLLCAAIDRLSTALLWVSKAALIGLIGVTLYEVVARYILNAPTLWSSDIGYMLNGALFLLAIAYTLLSGNHIRVDFFSARFSPRLQDWINAVFFAVVLLPALTWLSWVTARRFWRAYETGELDPMSSWAPLIWPFYLVITIGFMTLALQVLVETIRHIRGTSPQIKRG
ncbi:MAG: TRAP transporter small permease subunit [Alphaproteobacteria bacterium]|nr:TRAP transporter small permease subunit [Alphaproteobacteria bacterium]